MTWPGKNKYTLVRPILEYASPVWSPHLAKDIHEIEKVQRRALLITLGQRREEIAYEDRGKILKWNSLERRREFLSLVECYKTAFNLNGLNFSDYLELLCGSTKTRSSHQYKKQTALAKLNCYKWSFFVWDNQVFFSVIFQVINCHDSPNVNKFKLRLKNHMIIYWMDILYFFIDIYVIFIYFCKLALYKCIFFIFYSAIFFSEIFIIG